MSEPAIVVDNVSKRFRLYHERNNSLKVALMRGGRAKYEDFWALRDVAFEIPVGSTFGLIGENGSGKSTLLKTIAKILVPDRGSIRTTGTLAALLELGSGFHPELSGRENVFLNGSILGMSKAEVQRKFDEIVDFAGVEEFIDQPVKNYSSGMYVRLGFSIAINVDPDILLVDEVLAVGDQAFQDKCMEKFADFRRAGKTVVIVSHAMGSMRALCTEAAWLSKGRLERLGDASEIVDSYVDSGHAERQTPADLSGETRWGSGQARIVRVSVLDEAGEPSTRFYPGDRTVIRIEYQADQPVAKPVFGLSLETIEGLYAWAFNTRDGGVVPEQISGRGSIELVIPELRLQSGTYDLNAAIVDYTTTHTYDFIRACYRFDVLMRAPHESGGIVVMGGTWSDARSAPAP